MKNKRFLILAGSPKKNGNTSILISHFIHSLKNFTSDILTMNIAASKYKFPGCISCRACQKNQEYGCVIADDGREVLEEIIKADMIVFATPMYFFGPSAQTKIIIDRMFSLYKWDNEADTMKTVLKEKRLILLASC